MTKKKEKSKVKARAVGGRPKSLITDEQIEQIRVWAAAGVSIEKIADGLGMGETTFSARRKEDLRVSDAYKKGRAEGIFHAASRLTDRMALGDTTAIIFKLKTQDGWSTAEKRLKLEISGNSSPEEIINAAIDALAKGKITVQEAAQIAQLANTKANIKLGTTLNEDNKIRPFSREELREKLEMTRQLLTIHNQIEEQNAK